MIYVTAVVATFQNLAILLVLRLIKIVGTISYPFWLLINMIRWRGNVDYGKASGFRVPIAKCAIFTPKRTKQEQRNFDVRTFLRIKHLYVLSKHELWKEHSPFH